MSIIVGVRGTGAFTSDERPKNWREMILYLDPNGSVPLTGLTSKMRKEVTDDAEFNWFEKAIPTVKAYIDNGAGYAGVAAFTGATAAILVDDGAGAAVTGFRAGDMIRISQTGETCYVKTVSIGATETTLTVVRSIGSSGATAITNNDEVIVVGSAIAEGASVRSAKYFDPTKKHNYTQIFRYPVQITGTGAATKLRTGPAYRNAKREAMMQAAIEMERAFFFGHAQESNDADLGGSGTNNLMWRSTGGIFGKGADGNLFVPAANRFTAVGNITEALLDQYCATWFQYGSKQKIAFCGPTALRYITAVAKASGTMDISPSDKVYGMDLQRWLTPFGTLFLKHHPLFGESAVDTGTVAVVDMANIVYRHLKGRDLKFLKDRGNNGDDSQTDEFLVECGLEVQHGTSHGLITGITGAA